MEISKSVFEHLKALESDPLKGHSLAGSLQGARSLEEAAENVVIIFAIGPRENFYKSAEKRAKRLIDLFKKA